MSANQPGDRRRLSEIGSASMVLRTSMVLKWGVIWALSLGVGAIASAQSGRDSGRETGRESVSIDQLVPPIDRSTSEAAEAEMQAARVALTRAQFNITRFASQAEAQLRGTDEYRAAQIAVNEARSRYQAIVKPILEALKQDEEYARLANQRESAREVISQLVEEQRAEYLSLLPYAKEALEAGKQMSRRELVALALDPAVEEARMDLVAAYARLRELNGWVRQTAAGDTSVQIARSDLDAARLRYEAAAVRYNEALKREEELERQRQRRIELIKRGGDYTPPDESARRRRAQNNPQPPANPPARPADEE
jgi:hypothetical protein